jgi:hypothetical protein
VFAAMEFTGFALWMRWLVALRATLVVFASWRLAFAMFAAMEFAGGMLRVGKTGNDFCQFSHLMGELLNLRVHVTVTGGCHWRTWAIEMMTKALFVTEFMTAVMAESTVVMFAFASAMMTESTVLVFAFFIVTTKAVMMVLACFSPRRAMMMAETALVVFAFFTMTTKSTVVVLALASAMMAKPTVMVLTFFTVTTKAVMVSAFFAVVRPLVLTVLSGICPRRAVMLRGAFFMVSNISSMMLTESLRAAVLRAMHECQRARSFFEMIRDWIKPGKAKLPDGFLQVLGLFRRKSGRVWLLAIFMLLRHAFLSGLDVLLNFVGLFIFTGLAKFLDVLFRMFEHLRGRHHAALMLAILLMWCRSVWWCGRVLVGRRLIGALRSQCNWQSQRDEQRD